VLHLRLIILLVVDDVSVDSKTFLVTDFINLKIKSTQCFECPYMDTIYIHMFIEVSNYVCINI
jgi:hypothetical protein